jgi:hypothetical protein
VETSVCGLLKVRPRRRQAVLARKGELLMKNLRKTRKSAGG